MGQCRPTAKRARIPLLFVCAFPVQRDGHCAAGRQRKLRADSCPAAFRTRKLRAARDVGQQQEVGAHVAAGDGSADGSGPALPAGLRKWLLCGRSHHGHRPGSNRLRGTSGGSVNAAVPEPGRSV
ncbi:hypothetical protein Q5P01_013036 [Channa striata]|uniref:Uncharacterized protein n=1 Tax=Channa striata TaxID=64152 RepID=A0AA88MT26_CHASR|nr:hypothetical protein Q5P01_013036 [Channa striata]